MGLNDYRGRFLPDLDLGHLSRRALAVLGREYMMAAHLQDRAGIPQLLARFGEEAIRDVAIDEWMGASPVYTRRMQRALGFPGDDVATIFKGLQLDVGAPHSYLDFRLRVIDERHGEFWLPYCGALADAEPMGERYVRQMCHDIEDPTFDATAVATNPRARIRPIHRPPRVPPGRTPVCHWTVTIDPAVEPVEEIPLTRRVRASRLARLELPPLGGTEPGGWADYSGPFDPDFQLEDLGHEALARVAREFCVQGHLLCLSFQLAIAERYGDAAAREIAAEQWVGVAGIAAERIARALRIQGDADSECDGLEAAAKLLELHPSFQPRAYVDLHVELEDGAVRCWVGECEALAEEEGRTWLHLGERAIARAIESMVRPVTPRARCEMVAPGGGARLAWRLRSDPAAEPLPEPPEVAITRISTGASFAFEQRRPLRG